MRSAPSSIGAFRLFRGFFQFRGFFRFGVSCMFSMVCMFCIVATSAPAAAQDMAPTRVVPIQVNGDPATHFSLVVLGDGFTQSEMPTFRADLEKHLNILWSLEPFRSYRNYINVYAVEIASPESGITCDPAHRLQKNTPLGLHFDGGCTNPNARGILANSNEAKRYARLATPDFDQVLVIANTDTYGGIGGAIATTSGGNSLSPYITPHEIGHSLGQLQDEYTYYQRGVKGAPYKGKEPSSIHHTLLTADEMRAQHAKWWRWLGEPSESGGTIGRYEGGQYSVSGIWRPSKHSMMISLGYYFDQVSRERMTQRISRQVQLISASTPTDRPVTQNDVLWIETAHPVYAPLAVTWMVDGKPVTAADGSHTLAVSSLALPAGAHTISVKAVDTTSFVRDPAIRDSSLTATRKWNVVFAIHPGQPTIPHASITAASRDAPLGGSDVAYIETTHPSNVAFQVRWTLDGNAVASADDRNELPLRALDLRPGTHKLGVAVMNPLERGAAARREWVIDNTLPTVTYTLGGDTASVARTDGTRYVVVRDSFTMKLHPVDDMPGYLVSEFRLDGDGWHHYYGWPDAPPGEPFHFTPRGTTIKELVYGSLSSEGLSPQPWEARVPGYGDHRIEYRARDAAGNVGTVSEFAVSVLPSPVCNTIIAQTKSGDVVVQAGVTCVIGGTIEGDVHVGDGASLIMKNARIKGRLEADHAANVQLLTSTISGDAKISGTRGSFVVFGSSFDRALTVDDNAHAMVQIFAGNRAQQITCDDVPATSFHGTASYAGSRAITACGS
jgi:hypothetical protein